MVEDKDSILQTIKVSMEEDKDLMEEDKASTGEDKVLMVGGKGLMAEARASMEEVKETNAFVMTPEVLHDVRQVAPGWDPFLLREKWQSWMSDNEVDPPRDAQKAFVGFCRRFFEQHGAPGWAGVGGRFLIA